IVARQREKHGFALPGDEPVVLRAGRRLLRTELVESLAHLLVNSPLLLAYSLTRLIQLAVERVDRSAETVAIALPSLTVLVRFLQVLANGCEQCDVRSQVREIRCENPEQLTEAFRRDDVVDELSRPQGIVNVQRRYLAGYIPAKDPSRGIGGFVQRRRDI